MWFYQKFRMKNLMTIRLQLDENVYFITISILFGLCQLFATSHHLLTTYVPFLLFFHDKFGGKIGGVLVRQ